MRERSRKITWRAVIAKSCIICGLGMSIGIFLFRNVLFKKTKKKQKKKKIRKRKRKEKKRRKRKEEKEKQKTKRNETSGL
jgi:predicted histidine transporter YuiF (NhaC family)